MPSFKYKGRDKEGQLVKGKVEALSQKAVAIKLATIDIIPTSIIPISHELSIEDLIEKYFSVGPSADDLIMFSQQMHSLTKAGVSLIHSLRVVSQTVQHKGLRNALLEVIISLESGHSLSKSLSKHPRVFSPLMIALIEVGENTGHLEVIFKQIKFYFEAELETRRRIKASLRYPFMVIFAIVFAVGIINIVVIPSFRDFFKSFGSSLPLPTQILIGTSNFIISNGWLLIILSLMLFAGLVIYLNTESGKWWWSYVKLKIPYFGDIIQRSLLARFCRAFSLCLTGNVPLLHTFSVLTKVVENPYLAQKILQMGRAIQNGGSLYVASQSTHFFPPVIMQMLAVGEETGQIDTILLDVAQYYEKDVDYDLKKITDFLEPFLIGIIAIMVLILALGVFLPMWDISTVAFRKMEAF